MPTTKMYTKYPPNDTFDSGIEGVPAITPGGVMVPSTKVTAVETAARAVGVVVATGTPPTATPEATVVDLEGTDIAGRPSESGELLESTGSTTAEWETPDYATGASVSEETSRAEAAEASDVTTAETVAESAAESAATADETTERDRAEAAEASDVTTAEGAATADVATETTRAEAAESSDVTTAESVAEGVASSDVATETSRAEGIEAEKASAVTLGLLTTLTAGTAASATNAARINAALVANPGVTQLPAFTTGIMVTTTVTIPAAKRLRGSGTLTLEGTQFPGFGTALVRGPNLGTKPMLRFGGNGARLEDLTVFGAPRGASESHALIGVTVGGNGTAKNCRIAGCEFVGSHIQIWGQPGGTSQDLRLLTTMCKNAANPAIVTTTTSTATTSRTITVESTATITVGMVCLNISKVNATPVAYVTKVTGTTVTLSGAIHSNTGNTLAFVGGVGPVIASSDCYLRDIQCIAGAVPILCSGDIVARGVHWSTPTTRNTAKVAAASATTTVASLAGAGVVHIRTNGAAPFANAGLISVVTSLPTTKTGTAVIAYTSKTAETVTGCTTVAGTGTLKTNAAVVQPRMGFNAIVRATGGGSVYIKSGTLDNGNTGCTGLIWKIGGQLSVDMSYQNGSTQNFAVVVTQGATLAYGTLVKGTIPLLGKYGVIPEVIQYVGGVNTHDQVDPNLQVAPTAMKEVGATSTPWNPFQFLALTENTAVFTANEENTILRSKTLLPGTYHVSGVADILRAGSTASVSTMSAGVVPSLAGSPATCSGVLPGWGARTTSIATTNSIGVAIVSGLVTVTAAGTVDFVLHPTIATTKAKAGATSIATAKATTLTIKRLR